MIRSPILRGLCAGWRAHAETADDGLRALLEPPAPAAAQTGRGSVPPRALRAARLAVTALGRLPGPRRDTCLYRSVAECRLLRSYGVPAVVRLGIEAPWPRDAPPSGHAWVEIPGEPDDKTTGRRYAPLRPAAGRTKA